MKGCRALVLWALALSAKTYSVDGIVVAVDAPARTMLVSHRPIEGYMPAMMMPFRVADSSDLKVLYPGARIEFRLDVNKNQSVAREVRKSGLPDGAVPPSAEMLPLGTPLPEFLLTDQAGRQVELSDLRGKVLAIDFIYTRCPLPDVCPRLAANFAALQRRFANVSDFLLISVTVDPDYDTPAVLAEYARRWAAGPNWRFLTGEVAPFAAKLGEVYWSDEGSIGHTAVTTIVDRRGRIAARVDGSQWRIEQVAHLIESELKENP